MREALFARLAGVVGSGGRVLDLYAGTGTLGIEALSRGARRVVFVERSRAALAVLRRNLEALDLLERSRWIASEVPEALRRLGREGERFDLVLADPPYADPGLSGPLAALVDEGLLERDAVVVVERSRRHALPGIAGLASFGSRRYGDTVLEWLGPAADALQDPGEPTP